MGDLWQEHRRFIVTVVVGALVFLIAYLIINSIYGGEIRRSERIIRRAKRDQAQALPPGASLRDVRKERQRLQETFDELELAVSRDPQKEFKLTAGEQDPDLRYNEVVESMLKTVVEECALRNIDVDANLGRPSRFPRTRREVEHYLRGLDVVNQMLYRVLEADDEHEGQIARVERISISTPPDIRRGSMVNRRQFLRPLEVRLKIVGHPIAINYLFRPLAQDQKDSRGRYLAVKEATIKSLDLPPGVAPLRRRATDPLDRGRVELDLHVQALTVDREGRLNRRVLGRRRGS